MKLGHWLSQAFGYPWIERVEAAHLMPGDVLFVHLAAGWKRDEMDNIRATLTAVMPVDVRCVVMSGETRIDIVRYIDPGTRPLASGPAST